MDRDVNPSQGFKATERQLDWSEEDTYWRGNWQTRPYASADRGYDFYRPAYRYGFESASRYSGREFGDVERELSSGWERNPERGQSTWENIKDAVRDGWNRVRNR